jgi:hypothetical protein
MKSQNKKVQELTAESQEVVISTNWTKVRRALIAKMMTTPQRRYGLFCLDSDFSVPTPLSIATSA